MREIKFRVWDYHSNKYINDYITGTSLSLNGLFKNWSIVNGKNSLVFEQYTGLKDCNGVEIYEGDIVGKKETLDYNFKVIFKEGLFIGFNEKCEDFDTIYPQNFNSLEVVGNIYENPELLEV